MSNEIDLENSKAVSNTNLNLVEADIKLIGDRTTICQLVQFLAYVRYVIKHNLQSEIKAKIGSKVANGQLLFDVNGLEIPDLIAQDSIEIN